MGTIQHLCGKGKSSTNTMTLELHLEGTQENQFRWLKLNSFFLATTYGIIEYCQDWIRHCLVDWWRQATTWADVDKTANSSNLQLRAVSIGMCTSAITFYHLWKFVSQDLINLNLLGTVELRHINILHKNSMAPVHYTGTFCRYIGQYFLTRYYILHIQRLIFSN